MADVACTVVLSNGNKIAASERAEVLNSNQAAAKGKGLLVLIYDYVGNEHFVNPDQIVEITRMGRA